MQGTVVKSCEEFDTEGLFLSIIFKAIQDLCAKQDFVDTTTHPTVVPSMTDCRRHLLSSF